MFQWLWMNGNLICCFHVKYIIGDHSTVIKCRKNIFQCATMWKMLLFFTYHWVSAHLIRKYFNMLGHLWKRGADTLTAFGGIPRANVFNRLAPVRWHGGLFITRPPHRCLQMWQSKASSTQDVSNQQHTAGPVWASLNKLWGWIYTYISDNYIWQNKMESNRMEIDRIVLICVYSIQLRLWLCEVFGAPHTSPATGFSE